MRSEINLILQKQGVKQEVRSYLVVSIIFFIACFVITALVLVYTFIQNIQFSNLDAKEVALTNQIQALKTKRDRLVVLDERLSEIQKLLAKRKDISDKLSWLLENMPSSLTFKTVTVDQSKITMQIDSNDLKSFDDFFARLNDLDKTTAKIKKSDLTNFSRSNESGEYTAQLSFDLLN